MNHPSKRDKHRGFTLIELVLVLILAGVLAAVVVPRINTGTFTARGLRDETLALLRFAQKTAIAQRRTVCVRFTANSAMLTMASNAATNGCAVAAPLVGPGVAGETFVVGRRGATYVGVPGGFNFNGLGQPVDDNGLAVLMQTIAITNGPVDITVQAVTGFVQ